AIASAANTFAGSELDRSQVQQFVSLLTRVARTSGGGLILIAHPSLTGLNTGSGLSGSTQWHNSMRARFYIKAAANDKEEDDQPQTDTRVIEFLKSNYGPPASSVTVRYQNGVFAPVSQTAADAEERKARAKTAFVTILERFNLARMRVNTKAGPSYAPAMFVKEREAKQYKLTKEALRAAMMDLLVERKIMLREYGPPSNRHEELVVLHPPGAG